MYPSMTWKLRQAALGALLACGLGCGTAGLPGESIEADTGLKTGNPFEIRLSASRAELRAVLVNRASSEQRLLHEPHLQASTLELISATGSQHKPYDSRMLKKLDTTPYCYLFQALGSGKKRALGSARFSRARDGYTGQWGPFSFDELPAGEYRARVIWHSERAQCHDPSTRQTRKLPSVWRGIVRSNQVTLRLR